MNIRMTTRVLGAAFAVAGLVASATAAHADIKCRQTVAKESAKATQAIAKILQKCEQSVLDGKLTGPCPDPKGGPKIVKAKDKLKAAILKACATSTGEFAFGRCPNESGLSGSCGTIIIKTKDDEGTCLGCLAEHNAQELFQKVLYGSAITPADKDIGKCRSTTAKSVLGFYNAKSKALQKCHDGVLKGKIASCPDQKTTDALNKAESKKVASIGKACCGDDGVCGGATCSASTTPNSCSGGANDGKPCSPTCAGGANAGVTCTVDSQCPASTCTGASLGCTGGTCISTAAGDPCEAPTDCGRCRGGTTHGQTCIASGQCQSDPGSCNPQTLLCVGGTNDGHVCATNADCPSIAAGTCVGASGFCGGSDDVNPLTQLGLPVPCPSITSGGAPIVQTGVTIASLLTCLDTQADQRTDCQDAAGASFATNGALPNFCTTATSECASAGASVTVTVAMTTVNPLGGISLSLGYQNAMIPGVGDISGTGRVANLQTGLLAAGDADDSVIVSITDFNGLTTGNLVTVEFDTCQSGPAPVVGDFGCVVRSASDTDGADILDGVSCSVVSVN